MWLAIAVSAIVFLPTFTGILLRPENTLYLGIQYNIDDHMVYSAWMRQAMEGRLLFENRFTTIEQPGLTLHLYFLLLGWIAKVTGIPIAMHLGRLVFCFLSVHALARLIEHAHESVYGRKLALSLAVFGGGIGFFVWHTFGIAIVKPTPEFLAGQMSSRLPADVWQPEGFFFYSAISNGLFMVSAFLILATLVCALESRANPKVVLPGAVFCGLLMNIHSYDVMIIGLVFIGFVVALFASKSIEAAWLKRMLLIAAGAVPSAVWFIYVLKNDPVFQARAATETFSANYRSVLFAYLLLILLAIPVLVKGGVSRKIGFSIFVVLHAVLYYVAPQHLADGYFVQILPWVAIFAASASVVYFWSKPEKERPHPALCLFVAWGVIGLIAPYFPALFQRKLMMMLGVPWGVLAGLGLATLLESRERGQRNLLTSLGIVLASATGIQWISRELLLIRSNVSNTTVHSVYQPRDFREIIKILEPLGRKAVVACYPGVPSPRIDEQGQRVEDVFDTPVVPDFNPFITGLAGSRTLAGHWSETPEYAKRRGEVGSVLLGRGKAAKDLGITHLVLPNLKESSQPPANSFGKVLYEGNAYSLVEIN
jgi:hypothetical protein